MIVLKFGGTSVQSAARIDRVIDIVQGELPNAPVVVSSAMGKTTDALVRIGERASAGESEKAFAEVERLRESHVQAATSFLSSAALADCSARLEELFGQLSSLVRGLVLIRECTLRTSDALLSFGELLSTTIIHHRALERGFDSRLLDSRKFIRTDEDFTHASVDFETTNRLVPQLVEPAAGRIIVIQGFIGSTPDGVTTTLGRGGSDYTATVVGAALGADAVQIWTDVDGIMTADPRVIPDAVTIPEISYEEAAELAYFGAKVVHPSTIAPAVERGIPVLVRNTTNPDGPFTSISEFVGTPGLRAIAAKKGITLITINSSRMLNAYGFLSNIFSVFERHRISVDLIATSEVSVSMTVDSPARVNTALRELERLGTITVETDKSIICLVGRDLWKDSRFVARVFGVLKDTAVRLISLGSSDINLSIVVPEEQNDDATRLLHREFVEGADHGRRERGRRN